MNARKVPIPTPDDLEHSIVDELPAPENVIAALARVQSLIGGIEKRKGNNEDGGIKYAFRGIDAVAAAAQPLFGKYGVVIVPSHIERYVVDEIIVNGKPWTDSTVEVHWTIYGPGGVDDAITASTVGLGRDNSDKGYPKAFTQAYKNLLLRLLTIGDPADDNDGRTDERDARTSRRAPKRRSNEPPPTERDPAVDAVLDRLRALAAEHPDEAEAIRTWAHTEGAAAGVALPDGSGTLSGGALRDVEWRAQVVAMLDELDADRSPNGTSSDEATELDAEQPTLDVNGDES